jgi:hypothetical protein
MQDNTFFDEELFGEWLRRFLIQRYPNPERIDCPDSGIIRDIAFRRKVQPEIARKAIAHLMKCSECVKDALDYVEEYRLCPEEYNLYSEV